MIAEVVGGLWSNSLALLADAGHMLSDAGSLSLSLFALWIAQRPADPKRTYGYYRVEILAALLQGLALVLIAILILHEAYERFSSPPAVQGQMMMTVAVGGVIVNLIGLWLLHSQQGESLNVRGAFLHLLADTLGSVGAIVSGALIWAFGWRLADPVASAVISLLVGASAWPLLKQTTGILMEGAPVHIDVDEVQKALREAQGVQEVHDLHVWSISQGRVCMSGHVVMSKEEDGQALLQSLTALLKERFAIEHSTIQVERSPTGCEHPCS